MNYSYISLVAGFILLFTQCAEEHGKKQQESNHIQEETGYHDSLSHNSVLTEKDVKIETVSKVPFYWTLNTSGEILAGNKSKMIITAKSDGIVQFLDGSIFPGLRIYRGEKLFQLKGDFMTENNIELDYKKIRADLERDSANFSRAKKSFADKMITESDFLAAKNMYEITLAEFNNMNASFGNEGIIVTSPGSGFIDQVFINEGQKVYAGDKLASIFTEDALVLKAEVSPDHFDKLSLVTGANFKVGYSDKLYSTEEMNGMKISVARITGENSYFIPVFFKIDYDPGLIVGTYAEVYLKGKDMFDSLVVPNASLMEESGKLYVFIADDDGDFEKRYVSTGYTDGEFTQITSGLSENEEIVTEGAYLVRLSLNTAATPEHSHNH